MKLNYVWYEDFQTYNRKALYNKNLIMLSKTVFNHTGEMHCTTETLCFCSGIKS